MIALEKTDLRVLKELGGLPATHQLLLRLLLIAALFDWLVTRTFTRAAIFMPKPPLVILLYQILNVLGQFAFTLTGFVALIVLAWIAWTHLRARHDPLTFIALTSLIALSLFFLFVVPVGVNAIVYQLLIVASLGLIIKNSTRPAWINVAAPVLALLCATLYQLSQQLQFADATILFNLGELFFVLTPIVIARDSILRRKWIGLIAASAFLLIHLLSPSMTGIIAIWSIGLTLYLPSIFYALAIGCVCALAMDARTRGDAASRALPVLLILAGSYAPQLSAQLFLNLIGVWLLVSDHAISHRFA